MKDLTDPFSLQGKIIVVTGASSGIGRQCAWSCEARGASVVLLGRNMERLEEALNGMKDRSQHLVYSLDLCAYDHVETVLKEVVTKFGKIDGLVHSAGISTTLPFKMVDNEKLAHFFQTNVYAAMHLTRLAIKPAYLSEKGGSVVFISSVMGMVGEIGKTLYAMTKGALISGSRALALEYAPRRIRFNCISPGVVETPMSQQSPYHKDAAAFNRIVSLHPLGIGGSTDVANAVTYLLSDASKWITGSNLVVDGGYSAR
jgi:NAD(P)-dependent dehydrogenase (short-subunit alcohol dehydrogenase family)